MNILEKIDLFLIDEGVWKKVIRNKKLVKKLICPSGFKAQGGKCVKMKAIEMQKRKKSSKIAQKKLHANKAKMFKLEKKRMKSMNKRSSVIGDQ